MGNRERIIDAAVELMNKSGSSVGTTQLTNYLSISPGNLYYHFRNREEILVEVLVRLQSDLDEVLVLHPKEQFDAQRLAHCFIGGAKVLWQYRFFFSSSLELVMKEDSLSRQYQEFCVRGTKQVADILKQALNIAASSQRLTAAERGKLAENMWVLWTSWPRYTETMQGTSVPENEILRSHEQLVFLLKPYLTPEFYKSVISHIRKLQRQDDQTWK